MEFDRQGGQAMTREQEEAIEYLEQFIGKEKEYKHKPIKIKTLPNTRNAIETVLNMLKENSAEIEQKNTELAEKSAEIEKKDKEIDLMAETIRKLAISLASYEGSYNKETINFTGNIKDIKQYFEQKATKNS